MNIHYEKVVVGGSLEAFAYAFKHCLPVLYTNLKPPFKFDYLQSGVDFDLNINPPPNVLKTASGTTTFGPSKLQVWQKLLFVLSVSGKVIYGDTVRSAQVDGDEIQLSCDGTHRKSITFDQAIIFDDEKIIGLPAIKKQTKHKNIVYDWVNIVSGGSHEYDFLQYDDEFVNVIHFYPSERNDNTRLKDLVSVSYLTDEQLIDFSYSDTYVRFKLLDLFKELGIRGARNGRDVNRPGHYKYYAVKLEPSDRQVVRRVVNEYESDERLVFNYEDFSEIVKQPTVLEGYLKRICKII
mgnify:FL=1|tara:strand:- start:4906 stop:5787 length:882 start_codon:yes stop_codon:yes gene_type:complete